jgi:hypothetical protein
MTLEDIIITNIKDLTSFNKAPKTLPIMMGSRSVSWSVYWTTRSLFFLDGTIITVGESKYFKDRSSAARNFLITGHDFDSTWTKGFPYKSAATISAPAGDAVLIAADVNNFLYAGDGTPNQIPVVSLFQNIDYENKIFCAHVSQVLDAVTGVEVYEPRVKEIFMTAAALSASDLVKANTYFGVPAESATAYWVAKTGNDTTGNGTKAAPYLTIEKAYKTVASGSTIYVKSGVYTEEYNGTTIRYFYVDRDGTWTIKGIGLTEIKTVGITAVIRIVGGITNWYNLILNGENTDTDIINFFTATNAAYTYKCYFKGAATNNIKQSSNVAVNTYEAYDCVFTGNKAVWVYDFTKIKRCYIDGNTSMFANGEYHYNKHYYLNYNATAAISGCNSVKWNDFTSKSTCIFYSGISAINHSYNRITSVWEDSITTSLYVHYIENDACVPTIIGNKYYSTSLANTDQITFLYLAKCLTPTISGNIFKSLSRVKFNHVAVVASANVTGKVIFKNNYSHCNSNDSGITISIGGETIFNNKFDESEITGNHFIGSLKDYPTEAVGSVHCFLLSGCKNAKIAHNTFSYSGIGCALKTGTIVDTYTMNGVSYNRFINNRVDLWVRGVIGLLINNNSLQFNSGFTGITAGNRIQIDANTPISATNYSEAVLVKNTIIDNKSIADISLIYLDAHAAANGCIASNCTFNNNGSSNKIVNSYTTLAASDSAGVTSNCNESDPLFDENLIPASAITGAETLDAAYDDGLDIATNWGDSNTVPSVVLKQQGASWDMGAYVH